jgi:hypothetical protein
MSNALHTLYLCISCCPLYEHTRLSGCMSPVSLNISGQSTGAPSPIQRHLDFHGNKAPAFRFRLRNSAECGTKGPTEAERWHPGIHYNSRRFTLSKAVRYQQAISPSSGALSFPIALSKSVSYDYKFSPSFAPLAFSRENVLWTQRESADTLIAGKLTNSFSTVGGAASKIACILEVAYVFEWLTRTETGPAGITVPANA